MAEGYKKIRKRGVCFINLIFPEYRETMKIALCSSAVFRKECVEIQEKLEKQGHEGLLYTDRVAVNGKIVPVEDYYKMRKENLTKDLLDIKTDLMWEHFRSIEKSDAVLVINIDKKGVQGYVGGNTFLEMGLAFYLGKRIFLWKSPSKELPHYEEMMAMKPDVIEGDLQRI